MRDLASRLDMRIQLTTDGHQPYILAVERPSVGRSRITRRRVALHFMFYKFARQHKTLRNPYPRTPRWLQAWRITSGPPGVAALLD